MAKEFNIGLEYAENGVIVRQEYDDGAPLVELVGDDYKELIDSLYDMVIMLKEEGMI